MTSDIKNKGFTLKINNVEIAFHTCWEDCDGERWAFCVDTSVVSDYRRQCDGIRSSRPTIYDIASTLEYLDTPVFPSSTPPALLIGKVDTSVLMDISRRLTAIAKALAPQCTPKDSYYGV